MKHFTYHTLSDMERQELCRRPKMDFESVMEQIGPIIRDVKEKGDPAVNEWTATFDGVPPERLVVDPAETEVKLDRATREAIDTAYENIYRFHKSQLPPPLEVETMPGVRCMRITRPIERVGLYVPGGTAVLPSTLMMLGIPASLAGCEQILVATPPDQNGGVPDVIAYIAAKIGASGIVLAGGAQSVAAMAYGTQSVPKVDKILGPGNQYVTAAKMWLQNSDALVAIDMPAGPSEVLVIADGSAEPAFVAADLLSQAEHGNDSQVVLVAIDGFDLDELERELERQLETLPRRDTAARALENSFSLTVGTVDEAIDFSNRYAPEHLIVQTENASSEVAKIKNAGSVFLGPWSPESAGDYATGTNHTLPTYGYARVYSGVSVHSYLKFITVQELNEEGLNAIAPAVARLAEVEELEAHKRAVTIRLNN